MRLFSGIVTTVFASQCVPLAEDPFFLGISAATTVGDCHLGSVDHNAQCKVKCQDGWELSSRSWSHWAKCKCDADENCHYSYGGSWGSGELNKFPEFGCCLKPDKKVGTTAQRSTLNRNYGQRYAEADENFALFNLFFKNTEAEATDGYSFLLVIPSVLPEDVTVSGFARLELADIYRDETKGQTQIRLNSKAGFEALALDQKMSLMFALESSGETNVKTFADTNVIHGTDSRSLYDFYALINF